MQKWELCSVRFAANSCQYSTFKPTGDFDVKFVERDESRGDKTHYPTAYRLITQLLSDGWEPIGIGFQAIGQATPAIPEYLFRRLVQDGSSPVQTAATNAPQ